MIQISDIKKNSDQSKVSFISKIYIVVGIYMTYIILKIFPKISANVVTITLFLFHLISSVLLFFAIYYHSIIYWACSLLAITLSMLLDWVDGNIARYKKSSSTFGIILDRLAHNIGFPSTFISIGLAIYLTESNIYLLLFFIIVGIMSELNPIRLASIQTQFLVYSKTIQGDNNIRYDVRRLSSVKQKDEKSDKFRFLRPIMSFFFGFGYWNILFLLILVDLLTLNQFTIPFLFTSVYCLLFLIKELLASLVGIKYALKSVEALRNHEN